MALTLYVMVLLYGILDVFLRCYTNSGRPRGLGSAIVTLVVVPLSCHTCVSFVYTCTSKYNT